MRFDNCCLVADESNLQRAALRDSDCKVALTVCHHAFLHAAYHTYQGTLYRSSFFIHDGATHNDTWLSRFCYNVYYAFLSLGSGHISQFIFQDRYRGNFIGRKRTQGFFSSGYAINKDLHGIGIH